VTQLDYVKLFKSGNFLAVVTSYRSEFASSMIFKLQQQMKLKIMTLEIPIVKYSCETDLSI